MTRHGVIGALMLIALWFAPPVSAQTPAPAVPDAITAVWLSPDGTQLAVGGTNGLFKIVDAVTGADVRVFTGLSATVISAAFSPDGSQIAVVVQSDDTWRIYDTATGALLRSTALRDVENVAWNDRGLLAVNNMLDGDFTSDVFIYDTAFTEVCRVVYINGFIFQMDWHPTLPLLALASGSGAYQIDVDAGCALSAIGPTAARGEETVSVAFSPDGTLLAVGRRLGQIVLYTVSDMQVSATFTRSANDITGLAWSPDSQLLASVNSGPGGSIVVSHRRNRADVANFPLSMSDQVFSSGFTFTRDGRHLLFGDGMAIVRLPLGALAATVAVRMGRACCMAMCVCWPMCRWSPRHRLRLFPLEECPGHPYNPNTFCPPHTVWIVTRAQRAL